jgi:hypothetical protein
MNLSRQRKAERYQGEIPLEVKQGMGCTRNFSTSGIYFVTDQGLAIGEQLEVVLLLEHTGLGPGYRLRYQGEVLRVEPQDEQFGIAFAISSHCFDQASRMAEA